MSEELPPPFSTPMPEDRKAQLELFEKRAEAYRVLIGKRQAAAEARGRQLLCSMLDDGQRQSLADHGSFLVVGSEGGTFRISESGCSGNVWLVNPETVGEGVKGERYLFSFCAHFESQPDEFLVPYVKTLLNSHHGYGNSGDFYCCTTCSGPRRAWQQMTEWERMTYWPDELARQSTRQMLCQSDLMIAQMLKIRADECGWVQVAIPGRYKDIAVGEAYMKRIQLRRQQYAVEKVMQQRLADLGSLPAAIAAGPMIITLPDPFQYGYTVTRTLIATNDGNWVEQPAEPVPPPEPPPAAYARRAIAWGEPQLRLNVDAEQAVQDLGVLARQIQEFQVGITLTDDQVQTLRNLATGGR